MHNNTTTNSLPLTTTLTTVSLTSTSLTGEQVLWQGSSGVSVTFTLSGLSVSLSSLQLGHSVGLVSQGTVVDTVVQSVGLVGRLLVVGGAGLVVHNVGTGWSVSGFGNLGVLLVDQRGGVVAQGLQVGLHLVEGLGQLGTRHGTTVLQGLSVSGGVDHLLLLVSDPSGLFLHLLDIFVLGVKVVFRVVETFLLQSLFFLFQGLQLGGNVGVEEIVNVTAVEDFWHLVVLPLVVFQQVLVLQVDVVHTGTPVLFFNVTGQLTSVWIGDVVLGEGLDGVWDVGFSLEVVSWGRLGDVDLVENVVDTGSALQLLLDSGGQQLLTGLVSDSHHVVLLVTGGGHDLDSFVALDHFLEQVLSFLGQVFRLQDIGLIYDDQDGLVGEQRLDGVEQLDLVLDGEATLLGDIHEDTWGIDGLESQVLVVKVPNVQGLGGEGVWLHLDIGLGDASQERRLTDVRVPTDQQGSGVRINGRQSTQVLSDLFQIGKRVLQLLNNGGHSTQGGSLQLLTLEKRLTKLQQSDVISGHLLDQSLSSGHSS
ncbi:hypothetical protein WICPIJ_000091 [Wickerhamomyces pijperi]|uniref:Uncharacterized protein n=1 Tax=Wickerhamomyces pijperi TaxID=599730 RepID=A0A9P8QEI0_WICPI|nr:hypothetical protein WICPIJ_000091 [Wickerhamomyces pijperi]